MGALSIIIWTLTLIVSIKYATLYGVVIPPELEIKPAHLIDKTRADIYISRYMFIVLSADDDGEGGTFALYSLLARYANIVRRDPNVAGTVKLDRHLTGELKPMNKGVRSFIENSKLARVVLKILGVLGVAMVMASVFLYPVSGSTRD